MTDENAEITAAAEIAALKAELKKLRRKSAQQYADERKARTAARADEARELFDSGLKVHEIATKMELSRARVSQYLKMTGVGRPRDAAHARDAAQVKWTEERTRRARWILGVLNDPEVPHKVEDSSIKILELASQGFMPIQIAEKLGGNSRNVRATLERLHNRYKAPVETLRKRQKANFDRVNQVRRDKAAAINADVEMLHNLGAGTAEIAARLGLTEPAVKRRMRELDIKPNASKIMMSVKEMISIGRKADLAVIRRRLARGMSISQMAIADECSRGRVITQMLNLGFKVPEDEMWTRKLADGTKVPYDSSKRYWVKGT